MWNSRQGPLPKGEKWEACQRVKESREALKPWLQRTGGWKD